MNHRTGCQPLRDVLIVGGRPAFVRAVGEEIVASTWPKSIGQKKGDLSHGVIGFGTEMFYCCGEDRFRDSVCSFNQLYMPLEI